MSEEVKDVKKEESSEVTSATEETEVETEETEEVPGEQTALQVRLDELSSDNKRQKALLDQLMLLGLGGNQGVNLPKEEDDSEIDPVISKKLKALEQRQTQQFQGMLGGVFEEMDRTAILSSPKSGLYNKYQQEVEAFRQQMMTQGRFFKREEALANILLGKNLLGETIKSKPKKLVKQTIVAGGETNKAVPIKKTEEKSASAKERLAGLKF